MLTQTVICLGLLITVDYFHAIDCISKDFMLKAFEKFEFGEDFIRRVSVLMRDSKSCVNYCGWFSNVFAVDSGIWHRCPFSPPAFILSDELLAIKIRDCKGIKGITLLDVVNGTNLAQVLKIVSYADDITLFWGNEYEMSHALSIMKFVSCVSGLEVNKQNSEDMWLGLKKHCTDTFYNFVWKRNWRFLEFTFAMICVHPIYWTIG